MKTNDADRRYAQMGMAALLPGMLHMVTLMQTQLEEFRRELEGRQKTPRLGRPRKDPVSAAKAEGARSGWPADPEERKTEMARRMAKWTKPKPSALSLERKKQWAALSPAKRKARLRAMLAGKKKLPVATLAVAS